MVKDKNFTVTFASDKVEVAKSGDIGYSQGSYTATTTDRKTKKVLTEKGKYVTVYKKQADGKWKAVADIWNQDATPRPQASPKSIQKVSHHKRAKR
jgi:ketosteroid isomerase-like protein